MGQFSLVSDQADFETLNDLFENSTLRYADRIAFRMKRIGERYDEFSYGRFRELTIAVAKYLEDLGACGKGKMIGLISENRPEWPIIYFAILRTGATVVPMDALLGEAEIMHIIKDAGVHVLFCSAAQYDKVSEVDHLLKDLKKLIVLDAINVKNRRITTLDEVITAGRKIKKDKPAKVKKNDIAALIYTSGTTGSSKGVMLSHWNIASNVAGLRRMIYFDENDVFLSVLPLHHTFECTAGMLIPVSKGCSITTAESLASKRIIANIRETGVTLMMGVPLLYEKMVAGIFRGINEKPIPVRLLVHGLLGMVKGVKKILRHNLGNKVFKSLREKAGLGSLRIMISGGAPLQAWVGQTFEHLGISFLNGYGLTETSPVLTVNVVSDIDNRTVGYPVHGIELAIDQPDPSGVGELKARGPFVMQGYYKNKKATQAIIRDGWLYTGDLARFDDKGRVIICGRCKNLIVTDGGKNVYPEEIELALNSSTFIKESLVIGRPISKNNPGEEVVAYVVPDYETIEAAHGTKITDEEIEDLVRREVNRINETFVSYKRIKECFIREEEFPKTSTRKIKRYLFQGRDIHVQP